ncbi:putative tripartite motif protein trim9 [Fasciola hepatica]|uniref:Tripartite motif protein trim9 n=1 Tax=Fasciola hepatica TaxID=6192 RepID=A0A4E0RZ10_FASHE|nr:putative tripartite motif protein trim9 [Fasciola hepatica]
MLLTKLKTELTCPVCQVTFQQPLLLPCGHSVCTPCANKLWFSREPVRWPIKLTPMDGTRCAGSGTGSYSEDAVSEADSGVVVGCGTDSNGSLNNTQLLPNSLVQSPGLNSFGREPCPVCASVPRLPFDMVSSTTLPTVELAQNWWPRNIALEKLIARLTDLGMDYSMDVRGQKQWSRGFTGLAPISHSGIFCHLCSHSPIEAVSFCEQCQLLYCASCQSKWHAPVGPLIRHKLTSTQHVPQQTLTKVSELATTGVQCEEHVGQKCHLFCTTCAVLVCTHCLSSRNCIGNSQTSSLQTSLVKTCPDIYVEPGLARGLSSSHFGHLICSATVQAKRLKTDVTRLIQTLSEQARRGAEVVQELKSAEARLKKSVPSMEFNLNRDIDEMVRRLEECRTRLTEQLRIRMQQRGRQLREQSVHMGTRLSATTSLLHFGVELLKESDPAAFIQVCAGLRRRLTSTEAQFVRELQIQAERGGELELRVNTSNLNQCVAQLELQNHYAPPVPEISRSESLVDGNALHVVWYLRKSLDGRLDGVGTGSTVGSIQGLVTTSQSVTSFSQLSNMIAPINGQVDHKLDPVISGTLPSPAVALAHPILSNLTTPMSSWSWSTSPGRTLSSGGLQTTGTHPVPPVLSPTSGPAQIKPLFFTGQPTPDNSTGPRYPNFPASISAYVLSERDSGHGYCELYEKEQSNPLSSTQDYSNIGGGVGAGDGGGGSGATVTSQSMSTLQLNEDICLANSNACSTEAEARSVINFFLEVDNGRGGSFKVAYIGPETVCRLEGLQFNTAYRVRVRAANQIGYSAYSETVTLRTSRLATFRIDPHSGLVDPSQPTALLVGTDGLAVTSVGEAEDHVLLGNVGFSQGVHYWEWQVEMYDGRGQPSFGVALNSVSRDRMLGKSEEEDFVCTECSEL